MARNGSNQEECFETFYTYSSCHGGGLMKVAVVTPYYRESETVLRRCLDSVQAQTYRQVTHYMVADGHPRHDVLQHYAAVVHVPLPRSHGDFGDTPRGVGGMCALSEGADVCLYLDADNLLLPGHVQSVVDVYAQAQAAGAPLDAVFADRHIFFPDHPHLRLSDPEDKTRLLVDTNCISLARSAAFLWAAWGQIPPAMAPACDRVMFGLIRYHRLRYAWTGLPTVLYESNWSRNYRMAGLPVPASGLHDGVMHDLDAKYSEEEMFAHLRVRFRRPAK